MKRKSSGGNSFANHGAADANRRGGCASFTGSRDERKIGTAIICFYVRAVDSADA